ncbi:MAG: hypothetical protein ACLUNO_04545 [Oscillospiraceae bacterium]
MDSLERALYAVLTVTPGVDRQTVQNAIEAYTYFFEHLSFASVVGAISDFGYADGALNITANIAASPLYISLTPSRINAAHAGRCGQPHRHGRAGQRLRRRAGSCAAGRQLPQPRRFPRPVPELVSPGSACAAVRP